MKSVFAFALLLICSLIAAETWIYEKTVVELPMGEADNQLSLRLAPECCEGMDEGMDEGPTSFTIDEDENIYVITRRKDIIKKFDRYGNYICSSEYERNAGGPIRFLGYHDGMIYTMSGDSRAPYIRRYTRELELVDCHKVRKQEGSFTGLSFIENNSGNFGLLRNSDPRAIGATELVLNNNQYSLQRMDLFDFQYRPVDLKEKWATNIGYRFINHDRDNNLYIENLIAPLTATALGIITENGDFIYTDVVFDSHIVHGIHFYDRIYPVVSKSGIVYNLLVTEDNIELIRWQKTGVEQ
ncbi:MAG: hypothetical protein K8R90_03260 [Candidatus Cloacimonetes bacterium]|nr:hypothetical protein [Candidatus Cloacimonadota bacterium]